MLIGDVIAGFRDAIIASGLTAPDEIIGDGKRHRFASDGRRGDDAGFYVLHLDGIPAGHFGCWRSGVSQSWRADLGRRMSPVEAAAHAARVEAMRREREAEEARRHVEARELAAQRWNAAKPADPTHPYLVRKGVRPHGIRQDGDALLVPMREGGELHSLQTIGPNGDKRFLTGGRVAGCYHAIGKAGDTVCIAEGYSTGASIHEATGYAVAIAFSAGNLDPVARALQAKMPTARIILCADDDAATTGNPGLTKARDAARSVGGLLAVPDFGEDRPPGASDFNDLAAHVGAEAVREAVERASAPDGPEHQPASPSARAADSDGGDEWPEPQPLTAGDELQPYPLDALPAGIREAVAEVLAFVQCPPSLAACSALSALSLAGQALADVERSRSSLTGPSSLYLLAVADSGERKSTCDTYFLRAVREWEAEEAARRKPDVAEASAKLAAWEELRAGIKARIREASKSNKSAGDLTHELAEIEADKPEPFRVPRVIHADATPEALAWSLAHGWPSGGVMSAEAGIVFGGHGMGRDSVMRNLALLNALWDGASHRVERRSSDSFTIAGARLTMGLAAQPETVRQFVEGTKGLARGSGFAGRFLIAAPPTNAGGRPFRDPPDWRNLMAFGARLRALLSISPTFNEAGALAPPALPLSKSAHDVWRAFHDDVERELRPGGDMSDARDVGGKAADNAVRIAALFHVYVNGPTGEIGAEAVEAAARIVGWHLYQARAFLGEVAAPREQSIARRLDSWLIDRCARDRVRELPRRTIQNEGPNPVRGRAGLDAALRELVEADRVREVEAGRRKLVLVNPALLGGGNGAS